MTTPHLPPVVKVLIPLTVIVVLYFRFWRKPNFREQFGFIAPNPLYVVAWSALLLAFMFATDAVMHWRGPWNWEPWQSAPLFTNVCRVLAVVFLGPISEELIFRGLLQSLLSRYIAKSTAIVLLSLVWAAIHMDYSLGIRTMFFALGMMLGFSRLQTKSIWTPIVMHCLWNGYAIW